MIYIKVTLQQNNSTTTATIPHNSSAHNVIQTVQFDLKYTEQNKQWHLCTRVDMLYVKQAESIDACYSNCRTHDNE